MLTTRPFYHKLLRKYVVLFGNLFNNIYLVRKTKDDNTEIERIKVPILLGPKEKWVTRLESDPDLLRDTQTVLPRMSFEITSITYDPPRKSVTTQRAARGSTAGRVTSAYQAVPYDIGFELTVYARNIDDGAQIVEQILPYFTPDFTVTITPVEELGLLKDIPITLNSVDQNIQYEGGADSVRYVYWTLQFNMQAYFYGPVTNPKIIRTVFTNIFNDPSLIAGHIIKANLSNGNNGSFLEKDIVYQGSSIETAKAIGVVNNWNAGLGKITIGDAHGQFLANTEIKATSTNAVFTLVSFDANPIKLVEIKITPDPINAEPTDDYGFTTEIKEWPETE